MSGLFFCFILKKGILYDILHLGLYTKYLSLDTIK